MSRTLNPRRHDAAATAAAAVVVSDQKEEEKREEEKKSENFQPHDATSSPATQIVRPARTCEHMAKLGLSRHVLC